MQQWLTNALRLASIMRAEPAPWYGMDTRRVIDRVAYFYEEA
jgi:hypothetical protein